MTSKLLIILLISFTTCSSLRDLANVAIKVGIKSTSLALTSGSTIQLSVTCTSCDQDSTKMGANYTLTNFKLTASEKTAITLTCPESAALTNTTAVDVSCTTGAAAEAATYTLTAGTVTSKGDADTITPTLDDEHKTPSIDYARFKRYDDTTCRNYTTFKYTWTKGNVADETWCVCAYLLYKDTDGNEQTIYGDMVKSKLSDFNA